MSHELKFDQEHVENSSRIKTVQNFRKFVHSLVELFSEINCQVFMDHGVDFTETLEI